MYNDNQHIPIRSEFQLAEYELIYSESDLDEIMKTLSELEVQELEKLSALNDSNKEEKQFFNDLIDAVKQGAIEYFNSITDVSESIDKIKTPSGVKEHLKEEISKKSKPAAAGTEANWKDRTINEAQKTAFDKNVKPSTKGMSAEGVKRLERYDKAYEQRSKFLSQTSKGDAPLNRGDFNTNAISLSGLESFRYGPIVELTPIFELKQLFESEITNGRDHTNPSKFIRDHNYRKLDEKLMETFGFKTRKDAEQFRKEHNLTPHEGPNGIFLIPSDVHDAVSHNGYATKAANVIAGKMTEQEMERQIRAEKIEYFKHESKERGKKLVSGIILNTIRETAVFAIGVVCKEVILVFKNQSDNFTDDVKCVMRNVWNQIKAKVLQLGKQLSNGAVASLGNEILTALNDFIFKTAKNIFRIIRMMWKSLFNALKTIFSSKSSWGERIFEATKILSAGAAGIFGVTLNELIQDWLVTFMGPVAAPIIADIIAGFLGGILSAVMLMMFDKLRASIFDNKLELCTVDTTERIDTILDLKTEVIKLDTDRKAEETLSGFYQMLLEIKYSRSNITSTTAKMEELHLSHEPIETMYENEHLLNQHF